MKINTVLKPAMLFAAGSVASVASAATMTDTNTPYDASAQGTPITLAGANSAQYTFRILPGFVFDRPEQYVYGVFANGEDILDKSNSITANSYGSSSAALAAPSSDYGSLAITGAKPEATSARALAAASDTFYGLRFTANGTNYQGFASVTNNGGTIDNIEFSPLAVSAVPEPEGWALMIAGFGGLGLSMRRRRRQAAVAAVA